MPFHRAVSVRQPCHRRPECPRGHRWARCPCGCSAPSSVFRGAGLRAPVGAACCPPGWCWLCAIRSHSQVSGECWPLSGVQLGKGREASGGASARVALLAPSGPIPKAPTPGQPFAHLCSLLLWSGSGSPPLEGDLPPLHHPLSTNRADGQSPLNCELPKTDLTDSCVEQNAEWQKEGMDTAVSAAPKAGWGLLPAPDTAPSALNLASLHRLDQRPAFNPQV